MVSVPILVFIGVLLIILAAWLVWQLIKLFLVLVLIAILLAALWEYLPFDFLFPPIEELSYNLIWAVI